ncbi:MAG: flavin reductase family protein [Ferruginibacter sp.]
MNRIDIDKLQSWDRFTRANFVNSLSGFRPVSLIGTKHASGVENLAVFSNIMHLGADPALIGFINRPKAAAPHTIQNIETSGHYTINHIHSSFVEQAHQTSAKYPDTQSEFSAVGLQSEYLDGFPAPFVTDSLVKYALRLEEILPIRVNDTFLVIGRLVAAYVPDACIGSDGFIDLTRAGSISSNGLDAYYESSLLARLPYAKVPPLNPGNEH